MNELNPYFIVNNDFSINDIRFKKGQVYELIKPANIKSSNSEAVFRLSSSGYVVELTKEEIVRVSHNITLSVEGTK